MGHWLFHTADGEQWLSGVLGSGQGRLSSPCSGLLLTHISSSELYKDFVLSAFRLEAETQRVKKLSQFCGNGRQRQFGSRTHGLKTQCHTAAT